MAISFLQYRPRIVAHGRDYDKMAWQNIDHSDQSPIRNLISTLPAMIADAMRDVMREREKK
jgi:hypothetical protein